MMARHRHLLLFFLMIPLGLASFSLKATPKRISPFWAQEYTGADLMRQRLEDSGVMEGKAQTDFHSQIWDQGTHGEYVSNLMIGPHHSALIPHKEYFPVTLIDSWFVQKFQTQCLKQGICPYYINTSFKWSDQWQMTDWYERRLETKKHIIKLLSKTANKATIVSAANNSAFLFMDHTIKKVLTERKKIILVGSIDPSGIPSHFSSFGPEITISAPGGFFIRSYDFNGRPHDWAGTSGAVPQVTSSLEAFTLITGYPLNPKQAERMLQKTALPFTNLPFFNDMGGILNVYKIGEIGFRLKNKCQKNTSCFFTSLRSEEAYYFDQKIENKTWQHHLSIWFPRCAKNSRQSHTETFRNKSSFLNELRKAAFLNPEDSQLWRMIACVYEEKDLTGHVDFYKGLANRFEKSDREVLREHFQQKNYKALLWYASYQSEELKKIFRNPTLLQKAITEIYQTTSYQPKPIWDIKIVHAISRFLTQLHKNHYKLSDLKGILFEMIAGYFINVFSRDIYKVSGYEEFFNTMIHSEVDRKILQDIASGITYNAQTLPHHESSLKNIIWHPRTDKITLEHIKNVILFNAENIPNHTELLKEIYKHPTITDN